MARYPNAANETGREPRAFGELRDRQRNAKYAVAMKYDAVSVFQIVKALESLEQFGAEHPRWWDYVIGAGLAFDPLPNGHWTFVVNDRVALAADLAQLVRDRNRVMEHYRPSGEAKFATDVKDAHGKSSNAREKIG